MTDTYDLERFVSAQRGRIDAAQAELGAGRKKTQWMWVVFPQLAGLSFNPTAQAYAISDLAEAAAYDAHPVLGPRLRSCLARALDAPGSVEAIFGTIDATKLHACLTLFREAAPDPTPYQAGLDRFFAGGPDEKTLRLLGDANRDAAPR